MKPLTLVDIRTKIKTKLKEGIDIKVVDGKTVLPFKVKRVGVDFIEGRYYESYIDKNEKFWRIPAHKNPYEIMHEDFVHILHRKKRSLNSYRRDTET